MRVILTAVMITMLVCSFTCAEEHRLLVSQKKIRTKLDRVKTKEKTSLSQNTDVRTGLTWYSGLRNIDLYHATQTVEVKFRNAAKVTDNITITVYFFVKDQETKNITLLCDKMKDSEIRSQRQKSFRFISDVSLYSDKTIIIDGEKVKWGKKPCGYLVTFTDNDGLYKWLASIEMKTKLNTRERVLKVIKDRKMP